MSPMSCQRFSFQELHPCIHPPENINMNFKSEIKRMFNIEEVCSSHCVYDKILDLKSKK